MALSEVDLRWGVTDEQKAEGAVLPICLAEIDRSRPYFIGLLGHATAGCPTSCRTTSPTQLGWLGGLAGTSVTELEILHGVLNDPAAAATRSSTCATRRGSTHCVDRAAGLLGEQPSEDDIAALGPRARRVPPRDAGRASTS